MENRPQIINVLKAIKNSNPHPPAVTLRLLRDNLQSIRDSSDEARIRATSALGYLFEAEAPDPILASFNAGLASFSTGKVNLADELIKVLDDVLDGAV